MKILSIYLDFVGEPDPSFELFDRYLKPITVEFTTISCLPIRFIESYFLYRKQILIFW